MKFFAITTIISVLIVNLLYSHTDEGRLAAFYKLSIQNNCTSYGIDSRKIEEEAKGLDRNDLTFYKIKYEEKCLRR